MFSEEVGEEGMHRRVGKAHWAEKIKGSVSFDQAHPQAHDSVHLLERPLVWGKLPCASRLLPCQAA